ncbi:hypothetical protein ADUPG1_007053 [Aduncisulcus paluster]|uniref:Uncharacterized protein n=1 Tax=Aduncisulcus paluster TaxID=2918883 RepID=A0ABQ5KNE6_9EUKA|nr:hypothetical protein ADUPG1_007053 [Aduncisulcus paluster]
MLGRSHICLHIKMKRSQTFEIEKLKVKIRKLEGKLTVTAQRNGLSKATITIAKQRKDLQEKDDIISELRSKNATLQHDIDILARVLPKVDELDGCKEDDTKDDEGMTPLDRAKETILFKLEDAQVRADALQVQRDQLSREQGLIKKTLKQTRDELEEVRGQYTELLAEHEELKLDLEGYCDHADELESRLESSLKESEMALERAEKAEDELDQLQQETESLRTQCSTMSSKLSAFEGVDERISELEEERIVEIRTFDGERASMMEKISKYESELKDLKIEKSKTNSQLDEIQRISDEQGDELLEMKKSIDRLEDEKRETERLLSQEREESSELRKSLEEGNHSISSLRRNLRESQDKLQQTQSQLSLAQQQIEHSKLEISSSSNARKKLQDTLLRQMKMMRSELRQSQISGASLISGVGSASPSLAFASRGSSSISNGAQSVPSYSQFGLDSVQLPRSTETSTIVLDQGHGAEKYGSKAQSRQSTGESSRQSVKHDRASVSSQSTDLATSKPKGSIIDRKSLSERAKRRKESEKKLQEWRERKKIRERERSAKEKQRDEKEKEKEESRIQSMESSLEIGKELQGKRAKRRKESEKKLQEWRERKKIRERERSAKEKQRDEKEKEKEESRIQSMESSLEIGKELQGSLGKDIFFVKPGFLSPELPERADSVTLFDVAYDGSD